MRDKSILFLIEHLKLLILQEPLRVVNVVLHLSDALLNFPLGLGEGLAHFLNNQRRIRLLVLSENLLQYFKLFEAALKLRVASGVLVAEA